MPQCDERGSDCKIGEMEVLHSNAGYYLGYYCSECGPWDRMGGYFATQDEADLALAVLREDHSSLISELHEDIQGQCWYEQQTEKEDTNG